MVSGQVLFPSAAILCSYKPFTPNNIISFFNCHKAESLREKNSIKVKILFACFAPQKPYNLENSDLMAKKGFSKENNF